MITGPLDALDRIVGMVPILAMGYMVNYLLPIDVLIEDAKVWDFSLTGWVLKVALRDLLFAFVLIVGWYCILDYSRLTPMIKPLRFNSVIPGND